MSGAVTWLFLAAVTASSGSESGLELRLRVDAEEVEFGKAFSLTVVRRWNRELVPEAWNDEFLAPLMAQPVDSTRLENEHTIEETRLYRCYAFQLEDVVLTAPAFTARPRDGGPALQVSGPELRLRVQPALEPGEPGAVELPGELLPEPRSWLSKARGVVLPLLALGLVLWWLRQRVGRRPVPSAETLLTPRAKASQRLERLRDRGLDSSAAVQACFVEGASLLRDYLEEQFALPAPEMTTEQLLAAPSTRRALPTSRRDLLTQVLKGCDRVKFAGLIPTESERTQLWDAAAEFLQEPA